MEGMRGWVRRHGPSLDPARTRVVVLETLGSPELILLEGEGMIWMTDYDAEVRDFVAAAAERAGRAAAARAAARLRHRRAVGAARRAPDRHARLLRRVQDARQLPLAARHPAQRGLRDGGVRRAGGRGGDQDSSERARLSASSRVRISPAYCASSSSASSRPICGPGRRPARAASSSPRTSGSGARGGAALQRGAEHLARQLEVGGDRGLGVLAARGEPVGDGEDGDVGGVGLGRAQVAPDRAARERALVDEEAEPQVVEGERRDVVARAAARRAGAAARRARAARPRRRGRRT